MNKQHLSSNVYANVAQAIISALLMFVLYRYINMTLGVEQLGIWSVVLATVSTTRLVDLGLSAGVIRFVARDYARGDLVRAGLIVDTTVLTLMVVVGVVAPFVYIFFKNLLPHIFDGIALVQALEILPYAIVSLWLTISAVVFQGGLDGCRRMDIRAYLVIIGQIFLLILALLLVPKHQLIGLAWAQVGQGVFLLVAGRLLLYRTLPKLPKLPCRWNMRVLREMLGYGINLQAATIFMMLFDPVVKALMVKFGGTAAAGYFEMANQVVLKIRGIIVSANQAIVPHVAAKEDNSLSSIDNFYFHNVRAIIFVSLPIFCMLSTSTGIISWLLVGSYQSEFVFLLNVLIVCWWINILSVPAYFYNVGSGQVGLNTVSHMIMGLLNFILGWLLGKYFETQGVAFGYAISITVGSFIIIDIFQRRKNLNWKYIMSSENARLFISCFGVAVAAWYIQVRMSINEPLALIQIAIFSIAAIGLAVWMHPLRRQITGWMMQKDGTA